MKKKVFVIGGGAAGMMAAIACASSGCETHLFEKNEKLGKKLYLTGKGRCNLTNASDTREHLRHAASNPKFLYHAYSVFSCEDIMRMIEAEGVPLKIERGMRVFPESDKSSDIIKALTKILHKENAAIHLKSEVTRISRSESDESGIQITLGKNVTPLLCDACVVATGGLSYPSTGSTGDGYRFAAGLGHSVTDLYPALVPLEINGIDCERLQGLSLKNVRLSVFDGSKKLFSETGEMIFTHFGISGPLVLTASSLITAILKKKSLNACIDLKPALSKEQLNSRVLRDFGKTGNRDFKNSLSELLPNKIIPVIIERSGIDPRKKVNSVTKEERAALVDSIKDFSFVITKTRGFDEAIITKGGVNVSEIFPASMESRLVPGLYFAGEILDTDALTGGYNLQIAWSTGFLAGRSAAKNLK